MKVKRPISVPRDGIIEQHLPVRTFACTGSQVPAGKVLQLMSLGDPAG